MVIKKSPLKPIAIKKIPEIEVFTVDKDSVVDALVSTGRTTYSFALDNIVPLINRLDIQRKIQNPAFYERLRRDISKKCLMPPITLAFVRKSMVGLSTPAGFKNFLNKNIQNAFVLDGIQRLSTLKRAYDSSKNDFPLNQPLFINVLVCQSTDNLLYRMITLNNGQRPMTTRHQIEILTSNMFDGDDETVTLVKEKDGKRRQRGVFAKSDFVLGYIAFLSNSTTVDSQKLIQEKLDELIANKILEHDPIAGEVQFSEILELIRNLVDVSDSVDKWFRISNNLIGFCAGARAGYPSLIKATPESFSEFIERFEKAFGSFDVSKLKLGRARRNSVAAVIKSFKLLAKKDISAITEKLVNVIE